jgi:hypothetical protein
MKTVPSYAYTFERSNTEERKKPDPLAAGPNAPLRRSKRRFTFIHTLANYAKKVGAKRELFTFKI